MAQADTKIEDRRYRILTTASTAQERTHVLKSGSTFAVFDHHSDITSAGSREQGLYYKGTRHLSRFELWLGDERPVLLDSIVRKDNTLLTADFANPDVAGGEVPHGALHFFRSKLLWEGTCYEHLRIRNYGMEPVDLTFSFVVDADYADLFEVRGTPRARRGERLENIVEADRIVLGYRGLDGVVRKTQVAFSPTPDSCTVSEVHYDVHLDPHEQAEFYVAASCLREDDARDGMPAKVARYEEAKAANERRAKELRDSSCEIDTSNEQFNAWIQRSLADLNLLLTDVPEGYYPYAGIPWYSTVFGRDGILTALMTLWVNPRITRGVLAHLAATQADEEDPRRDAQPGKILHEARSGEMAILGEVPFRQYYGTVDATPLFVLLAGAYYAYTADRAFIEEIWPNVERALQWIDEYGDLDGDGFIEYSRQAEDGLMQQGWKDSDDSVFHADGRLAKGPIALCEVQGYVYAARRGAAALAVQLGKGERAKKLRQEARQLKKRFEEAFWCEDLSTYALALDGEKRPCRVATSNAGHALFAGIADEGRAQRVAWTLFSEESFSGWGVRTVAAEERRFNPTSYHNGSVWPHDNALIGWGLGRYGFKGHVHRLLKAFFDASMFDKLRRLPELFCGFDRRSGEGPTAYPVACSPQAWSTAAVFYLLQACLGLRVEAANNCLVLERPSLPPFLQEVALRNLRVGEGTVDLVLQRYAQNVGVEVTRRDAGIEVMTIT